MRDGFVAFDFAVANRDDAFRVEGDIVLVRRQNDGVALWVQTPGRILPTRLLMSQSTGTLQAGFDRRYFEFHHLGDPGERHLLVMSEDRDFPLRIG